MIKIFIILTLFASIFAECRRHSLLKKDSLAATVEPSFKLMLDPAGNANYAGRELTDCYEKGLTFQFCQELKKALTDGDGEAPKLEIIFSRSPGENISDPLQNANFANRMQVDLFLSIHFYQEENSESISIYYFDKNEPFKNRIKNDLIFVPYDKAYILNLDITKKYADLFFEQLTKQTKTKVNKPCGANLNPLIGITSPAILIEIGLKKSDGYKKFVGAIRDVMIALVSQHE